MPCPSGDGRIVSEDLVTGQEGFECYCCKEMFPKEAFTSNMQHNQSAENRSVFDRAMHCGTCPRFLARQRTCREPKCEAAKCKNACGGHVKALPSPQMPADMEAVRTYRCPDSTVCDLCRSTAREECFRFPDAVLKGGIKAGQRTLSLSVSLTCSWLTYSAPH